MEITFGQAGRQDPFPGFLEVSHKKPASPDPGHLSIVERSQQPEEASGLFIAVVQVTSGDKSTQMRMISEPDTYDQPTLWVLNDYHQ